MIGLLGTSAGENQQYWPVKNNSGEQIPAFACMRITGMFAPFNQLDGSGGISRVGYANMGFTVGKPDTYGAQYSHLFNGPIPIPAESVGQGTLGQVMMAAYSGGSPTVGNQIGPISGSWLLNTSSIGFQVVDVLLSETDGGVSPNVRVIATPGIFARGTYDGAGNATVNGTSYTVPVTYTGANGDTLHLHWQGAWYGFKV
jgi:hypothetical protein